MSSASINQSRLPINPYVNRRKKNVEWVPMSTKKFFEEFVSKKYLLFSDHYPSRKFIDFIYKFLDQLEDKFADPYLNSQAFIKKICAEIAGYTNKILSAEQELEIMSYYDKLCIKPFNVYNSNTKNEITKSRRSEGVMLRTGIHILRGNKV